MTTNTKEIGKYIQQPKGFKAFIPNQFPSKELLTFDQRILRKSEEARAKMGHLNGIAHHIPDIDFFIAMYVSKDATASSQIEGTNAGLEDVLESGITPRSHLPEDVDDILHYIQGLNYGLEALKKIPVSERLIKEMHKKLMIEARTTVPNNTPGEFRTSQNWIGGRDIEEAKFVPPPHTELSRTLSDLEHFIHSKDTTLSPAIQAALIHAQFETIHPFLDGNGRTGRMLITLFFAEKGIVEKPLLYLSHYLKKYQDMYYERLYRYTMGEADAWVEFFLDAIIEVATESIQTISALSALREKDRDKIVQLDKRSSKNILKVLEYLYKTPIITTAALQKNMGFTRAIAKNTINKMIEIGMLHKRRKKNKGAQAYEYKEYINIFL